MVEHPPTTAATVASNIKAAQAARAVIAARELVPDERSTRATGVSVFDAYSTNVVMSQCGRLSKGQQLRCTADSRQNTTPSTLSGATFSLEDFVWFQKVDGEDDQQVCVYTSHCDHGATRTVHFSQLSCKPGELKLTPEVERIVSVKTPEDVLKVILDMLTAENDVDPTSRIDTSSPAVRAGVSLAYDTERTTFALLCDRYFAALIERLGIGTDADPCAFTVQPLFAPIMADIESACHLYMDILKTEVCRCPPPTPYASMSVEDQRRLTTGMILRLATARKQSQKAVPSYATFMALAFFGKGTKKTHLNLFLNLGLCFGATKLKEFLASRSDSEANDYALSMNLCGWTAMDNSQFDMMRGLMEGARATVINTMVSSVAGIYVDLNLSQRPKFLCTDTLMKDKDLNLYSVSDNPIGGITRGADVPGSASGSPNAGMDPAADADAPKVKMSEAEYLRFVELDTMARIFAELCEQEESERGDESVCVVSSGHPRIWENMQIFLAQVKPSNRTVPNAHKKMLERLHPDYQQSMEHTKLFSRVMVNEDTKVGTAASLASLCSHRHVKRCKTEAQPTSPLDRIQATAKGAAMAIAAYRAMSTSEDCSRCPDSLRLAESRVDHALELLRQATDPDAAAAAPMLPADGDAAVSPERLLQLADEAMNCGDVDTAVDVLGGWDGVRPLEPVLSSGSLFDPDPHEASYQSPVPPDVWKYVHNCLGEEAFLVGDQKTHVTIIGCIEKLVEATMGSSYAQMQPYVNCLREMLTFTRMEGRLHVQFHVMSAFWITVGNEGLASVAEHCGLKGILPDWNKNVVAQYKRFLRFTDAVVVARVRAGMRRWLEQPNLIIQDYITPDGLWCAEAAMLAIWTHIENGARNCSPPEEEHANFDEPQHEPGCKCMGTACRHDNAIVFYCIYCGDVGPTFDQALQCEARCSGVYDVWGVEFIHRGMQVTGLDEARSMGNSYLSELVQKAFIPLMVNVNKLNYLRLFSDGAERRAMMSDLARVRILLRGTAKVGLSPSSGANHHDGLCEILNKVAKDLQASCVNGRTDLSGSIAMLTEAADKLFSAISKTSAAVQGSRKPDTELIRTIEDLWGHAGAVTLKSSLGARRGQLRIATSPSAADAMILAATGCTVERVDTTPAERYLVSRTSSRFSDKSHEWVYELYPVDRAGSQHYKYPDGVTIPASSVCTTLLANKIRDILQASGDDSVAAAVAAELNVGAASAAAAVAGTHVGSATESLTGHVAGAAATSDTAASASRHRIKSNMVAAVTAMDIKHVKQLCKRHGVTQKLTAADARATALTIMLDQAVAASKVSKPSRWTFVEAHVAYRRQVAVLACKKAPSSSVADLELFEEGTLSTRTEAAEKVAESADLGPQGGLLLKPDDLVRLYSRDITVGDRRVQLKRKAADLPLRTECVNLHKSGMDELKRRNWNVVRATIWKLRQERLIRAAECIKKAQEGAVVDQTTSTVQMPPSVVSLSEKYTSLLHRFKMKMVMRDAAAGDTDCPQNVIDETIAECDKELVAIWHEVEACEKEMEGEL